MKTFVFFSLPAHGHTNPTLPVVRSLVSKGHKVIYYSLPEFQQKIEHTGAIFREYPAISQMHTMDTRLSKYIGQFAYTFMKMTEAMTETLVHELSTDKPDCVVYDSFALWGKTTALSLGIPAVSMYTTFAFNAKVIHKYFHIYLSMISQGISTVRDLSKSYAVYLRLAKRYGFRAKSLNESIFNTERLNIVFTSRYLQPGYDSFDDTFHFVGPSMQNRSETADFLQRLPTNKKIIYISIGTIFNDNLQFFINCIEAFGNTEYHVVLSLGNRFTLDDLPPSPNNIVVRKSIPQLEVLQCANLFISHGGMNSLNESLYYGVPMLLIPQMSEQQINALRVQELGAGKLIDAKKLTKEKLLQLTAYMLQTPSYAVNAAKIQETLQSAGGYIKAADLLLQFVTARGRVI